MKFTEDSTTGMFHLRAYGDGWVRVNERKLTTGFAISPQKLLVDEWEADYLHEMSERHLQHVFALQPEVILIGAGKYPTPLLPETHKALIQSGIGFEVMPFEAACRTYPVVQSENRIVVAILFPTKAPG